MIIQNSYSGFYNQPRWPIPTPAITGGTVDRFPGLGAFRDLWDAFRLVGEGWQGYLGDSRGDQVKHAGSDVSERHFVFSGDGDDTTAWSGNGGNDRLRVRARQGDDSVVADGGDGKDRIRAGGGRGDDRVELRGGNGHDRLTARGGRGQDSVTLKGGRGSDMLRYRVGAGKDTVDLRGGGGQDHAEIYGGDKNFVLVDEQGKTLYQQGEGGTTIRIHSLENFRVLDQDGKAVFSRDTIF